MWSNYEEDFINLLEIRMSVICHNFVQNAWKKDLCSNCFKSVGDHEGIDIIQDTDGSNSNCIEHRNGRHDSQTPSPNAGSNGAPHTTWKSLISEKNGKNSQPFKLENGFKGRLLTINKALNGTDKQNYGEMNRKDRTTSQPVVTESSVNNATNGCLKKPVGRFGNGHQIKQNGSIKNGIHARNEQSSVDKTKVKNAQVSVFNKPMMMNGHSPDLGKDRVSDKKTNQAKFAISSSEDVVASVQANLHSILKKSTSTPVDNGGQYRRSSNVGFKDEEPLVIGYGGRDFSPEELEWEMASDGEAEGVSDSLDETEDDRVFSKMTRQNTEFNSDNANLIENERKENQKNVNEINKSKQNETCQPPRNKNDKQTNSRNEELNTKHTEPNRCQENKNKVNTNGIKNDMQTSDSRKKENCDSSNCTKISAKSKGKTVHSEKNSINVAIRDDKQSHAAKTGEVTVLQTTETASSGVEVKNSSAFINGATPPPSTVDVRKNSECGKAANAVMFSDGEESTTWQENAPDGNNGEWQDGEEISGQILQAINTSLTNRHKMREENPDVNSGERKENEDSHKINVESESNTVSVSVNNGVTDASNEKNTEILTDVGENILNVEPRESFLHGAVTKPSAIYGPASDLFVSRSNSSSSSSSSSSDDQGKSQISLSINVIVNGEQGNQKYNGNEDVANGVSETSNDISMQENNAEKTLQPVTEYKEKPKIPTKPTKSVAKREQYNPKYETRVKDEAVNFVNGRKCESVTEEATYYSTIPDGMKTSINLVDPYAEGNIYQEVTEKDLVKTQESEPAAKVPGRESKLAALAIELEQVRNTSTKRQAPAPPKVPDPPQEDPPSCTGRVSPTAEVPQTFSSFRGESMGFSSASSTTSTSSQDTEAGYASWNLHGNSDDPPKQKLKSSFLLAQYSKCKMLAMGYAEDGARARKKIKSLLKIGKESEAPATIDPNCPNPKAWKYSDHFERPRAKLEIIHPMDLETKSVTVNPGFDSLHSGTMSSFSANPDDACFRNSVSSDYGSFYSDTLSPGQDLKHEVNYEYIQPRIPLRDEHEESSSKTGTSSSTSPTPSRSSTTSQASTVTSGSSKNGVSHRPPKPPPPPRAHSLLPGNKIMRNVDGTFKFPNNGDTSSSDEVTVTPTKPQAPRRQCKSAIIRSEYTNLDEQNSAQNLHLYEQRSSEDMTENSKPNENEGNYAKNTSSIHISHTISQASHDQQDVTLSNPPSPTGEGVYDNYVAEKEPRIQTSITIKTCASPQKEKLSKSMLSRNKHPPITKSPARPPPIYSKPQSVNFPKNTQPWKTLEDSYLALTSSNRELLIKLVNQALKRRKNFSSKLNKFQFQWSDFEIDASQPSSIFAFGEKIAYHATMPQYSEYALTLVISIQHPESQENTEMKYPMFGKFTDCIPSDLLDSADENDLESIPATVLVLDRAIIATIESFSESLPDPLTEENEKELCFIILQLIQSLKSLQVQGIESIDSNFQNVLLAKTEQDKYHSLVFLHDNSYEENDYAFDSCKISLCQYTLMLLFQMLKLQANDGDSVQFSTDMSKKVFETAFSLLSEEKAVSLSQTKTLFECYLWGVTKVLEGLQSLDDCDSILHRWLDIERSNFIKSIVSEEESKDLNVQNEYYSQFLTRTNARNIKEIASYL